MTEFWPSLPGTSQFGYLFVHFLAHFLSYFHDSMTYESIHLDMSYLAHGRCELEATGPGAQLAIPSLTRIWLGDRDRE